MSTQYDGAVLRPAVPEVEVVAKAIRRRFTAEDKRRILREAEACTAPGALGALLRREGLSGGPKELDRKRGVLLTLA